MRDIELECVPAWRYCQVRDGEKIPYPAGWQNQPRLLEQVLSNNLGLLLGSKSGGVVALDFDGPTAWQWYSEHFGADIPTTIAWTSGKDSRCQMAFAVPEDYWPLLRTLKIATGDHEGFEFRWDRTQSVMPPSSLADGRCYAWVSAPSATPLSQLPQAILEWWVLECNPERLETPAVEYPPATEQEVVALAARLKQLYPELGYEQWTRATWAFCNTVGTADGIALMRYHYPEKSAGEYDRLRSESPTNPVRIGTIYYMIQQRDPDFRSAAEPVLREPIHNVQALQYNRRERYKLKEMIRNG